MLTWLRQKYAARKVKRAELRAAQKAADAAIKADPLLHKRAVRRENIKFLRRWSLRAAFAVAVTGVTTVQPDLVSTTLDQDAAAHGIKGGLQKNFATSSIRVYQRNNPLMPFHLAGQAVRIRWQEGDSVAARVLATPLTYTGGLITGIENIIFASPLDAYSLSDNGPHGQRQCFIRPPSQLDSVTLFKAFTGLQGDITGRDQNPQAVSRYYYTLVMAHEARHCDQDKNINAGGLNEIDADIAADRIVSTTIAPEHHQQLRSYWAALRLVHAVVGGDIGHYSTPALFRGSTTPMQSIDDTATVRRLAIVMQDAEKKNAAALDGLSTIERRYHLALALLADPHAGDAALRGKAALFARAVNYLNGMVGKQMITTPHAQLAPRLDMTWLTRNYNPVPEGTRAQPKTAPAAPRANS